MTKWGLRVAMALAVVASACSSGAHKHAAAVPTTVPDKTANGASALSPAPGAPLGQNIYAATGVGDFAAATKDVPYRIYVPNSDGSSVDVINPETYKVIDHYPVGRNPQHVVPAWDLRTLYVANDLSSSLTPIDPVTGKPSGPNIPVDDPYNMYFTPDGSSAIVVAEAHRHLDFRDPHTFALQTRVPVTCKGIDHMDFSADGRYLIASCEFSGQVVKVDVATRQVVGYLATGGAPQDVKVDPAGKIFYVADMKAGGLHEIDGDRFTEVGFLPTGPETHGLYPSRDARFMYVTNRGGAARHGSISVVDFTTRQVVQTWKLPGNTTPDMGGVSPDGKILWVSGRRDRAVYAIDTTTGAIVARIRVGAGPHGLCVWPQPGRYSLGHTGILR
ncbi:MAG: YncE family protein [Actinobacteria bacterium]|nr:YncE family protein [Actinomycetota bacterium]